jgi:hypothetical protein
MHSIGRESWINLPIAASPVFSIRANRANIPYVNKRDFEIQLDATEVGAGQQYQVLVSASGWDKVGHFFGSGPAKVNLDSSDPIYNNFLGNTDLIGALDSETGRATVTFTLNTDPAEPGYLDPSVIGKRLSFIAVKNNGTSQSDVSGITQVLVTGD